MELVRFEPLKHREAFEEGNLYSRKPVHKGNKVILQWEKVTDKDDAKFAQSTPIFFAVRIE